jgi:hypothetical protein
MEHLDHTHTSGHSELVTQLKVLGLRVALVIAVTVLIHHSHQMKLEKTTSACDRADEFDPLWTGESCANDNPCCSFNNPPYFSVQLPAVTTDRIELRICTDEAQRHEAVLVLLAEIYDYIFHQR